MSTIYAIPGAPVKRGMLGSKKQVVALRSARQCRQNQRLAHSTLIDVNYYITYTYNALNASRQKHVGHLECEFAPTLKTESFSFRFFSD